MDSPTIAVLLALATGAICGFIGYWLGVGDTERTWIKRESELLDALDHAVDTVGRLSRERHPSNTERPGLKVINGGAS